ncbi:MAG: hypothetical protein M0R22_00520 [Dehalococcoidia bacterium]|nr:hypothetical protein [Dehalococcoidia bacterium]
MRRSHFGATGSEETTSTSTSRPSVDRVTYSLDPARLKVDYTTDEIPFGQMSGEGTQYDNPVEDELPSAEGEEPPEGEDPGEDLFEGAEATGLSTGAKVVIGAVVLGGVFLIVRGMK